MKSIAFLIFHVLFIGMHTSVHAQVMLDRWVLSSASINAEGNAIDMYATLGQSAFSTLGASGFYVTQGFEQPVRKAPLEIATSVVFNRCDGQYEYTITAITGCVSPENATVQWDGVNGDTIFQSKSPHVLLTVSGSVGCQKTLSLDASGAPVSSQDCPVTFYSYISPNGDGMNEKWIIDHISLSENRDNEVALMNRWGEEVWRKKGYDNQLVVWDGRDALGNLLPDGTYFYSVRMSDQTYTGFVELQR